MIELQRNHLAFSFPEVHPSARLSIDFRRTLRIPDDGKTHALPPGLGLFPLRHVDDGKDVPADWLTHGGVMLPMYQAEAMWISFDPEFDRDRAVLYPFAIRIAAGKINAVTGQQWTPGLHENPQDYMVAPSQPWLDGFCVTKGTIRQFVAMPLGQGYTAEEQITGAAVHGGLQIVVYPMKADVFERRFARRAWHDEGFRDLPCDLNSMEMLSMPDESHAMGLAPGGRMTQEIYDDPFDFGDWDLAHSSRCFVHIANSQMWQAITGEVPPTRLPTAADYAAAGLPWFDYYSENQAVDGSPILAGLKSVLQLGQQKGESPLPENAPVSGEQVVVLSGKATGNRVREGSF